MSDHWKNRIVGHGEEAPEALVPNERNWRTHPRLQREALDRVGWVQDIVVNRRSGRLVDGHLRVAVAVSRGEPSVPVVCVDLDERDEAFVLATLDPLAAMAEADGAALEDLVATMTSEDLSVRELLTRITNSNQSAAGGEDWIVPASGRLRAEAAVGIAEGRYRWTLQIRRSRPPFARKYASSSRSTTRRNSPRTPSTLSGSEVRLLGG